jgi:raffinose/stachyose/melibiose transport system permease protein
VGTGNYDLLLNTTTFQDAIRNSFTLMLLSLGIQLPIALTLALMVGRGNLPGRRLFRTILFVPYVFSEVITAIIWRYVLHPSDDGLVNVVLGNLPGYETIGYLADRNIVLYAIFAVITWKYFGFHMILYMAGLQAVPKDLEDAARIDGANEERVLRYITLPLMGSTIRLTVFLSILGSFQQFVIIWVLTQGGPFNSSQVITTYLYKYGVKNFKLGYGSAIAIILFAITLIFSLGYQRIALRQDYGHLSS